MRSEKKETRAVFQNLSSPAVLFPDLFFTGVCVVRHAQEQRVLRHHYRAKS